MKFILKENLTPLEIKIFEAAVREFEKLGYFQANVEVIAEKVGIGKGTVYRHFGKKFSLFLTVVMRIMTEMEKEFQKVSECGNFHEALDLFFKVALSFNIRRGSFIRAVSAEERMIHIKQEFEKNMDIKVMYSHMIEYREKMILILQGVLEKGRRENAIHADINIKIASEIIFMTINQFFRTSSNIADIKKTIGTSPKFSQEQGIAELKKLILRGLGIEKMKGAGS